MNLNFLSRYSLCIDNSSELFYISLHKLKGGEYHGYYYIHPSDILSQHIGYVDDH
ncbi:hypothetical protein [uncultured Methanobrevibacter sp.]|uniref:hypothetical protein n=1 Tax=uncultured Methanobrevibacter sp. TaxID=253161 RepID=UPI0025DC7203|nr:hypothetical protein [uncultured Methanobrevibacter sp.]